MNCKKCGFQLTDQDRFCKNCGLTIERENIQVPLNTSTNNVVYSTSKNSNTILIVLSSISIVIIVTLVMIIVNMKNQNEDNSDGTSKQRNTTIQDNTSSSTVNVGKFSFNIPKGMTSEVLGNELELIDDNYAWNIALTIEDGVYDELKENRYNFQSYFEDVGMSAKPSEVKVLGGVEYITTEISATTENYIIAYAKLNSMYVAALVVADQNNSFNYEVLKEVAPLILSAKYKNETSSFSINGDLNPGKIFDYIK